MATLNFTHSNNYNASGATFSYTEETGAGTPGVIVVSTGVTTVDLSQLTSPEIAVITNHDEAKVVVFGVESGGSIVEVATIPAGASLPQKLSPNATYMLKLAAGETGDARVSFEGFGSA